MKTTTGSALDGAVFDLAQILAYLVHNMSRYQLYLGFGHFGWLFFFFGQYDFCGFTVKLYFICWNYPFSSGWHIFAAWDFVSVLGFSEENLDLFCKLLQSLFLQWFVNLVGVKPNQSINCLWATAHANTLAKWYVDAKLLHLPTCGPINGLSILWSMAEGGVVLLMPWCIYLVWPITGFL